MTLQNALPKIGAPATRALLGIGITKLSQLTKMSEESLLELHGMGPKAIGILKEAMKGKELAFRKDT